MRRNLVVGNWKMHGTLDSVQALVAELVLSVAGSDAEVALCSPYVHIGRVASLTASSGIAVGAQDCSQHESGAYTGEVAAEMLREVGCDRVVVGHSERRQYFGESNELVAEKALAAKRAGLVPIMCVGETLKQREDGQAQAIVGAQLQPLIASGLVASDVIAYEPVWAIGTGQTASPEQAQEMHEFIRGYLQQAEVAAADSIRLLYGGSVKAANAAELFAQLDIDGGLVGGASLDAAEFSAIVAAAG
jgi:triosephosphate isomerase